MIQRMVDAVSDQLEDCLSLIHRFQKPTEAHTGTELYWYCTVPTRHAQLGPFLYNEICRWCSAVDENYLYSVV